MEERRILQKEVLQITPPNGCKVERKNDTGKGVLNSKSKSQENNPDFHVHCNIQCRQGEDYQELRAQCLKVGQGRAKVKVSRSEIKIENGPGKTGLEGSSMTYYKKEFRIALRAAKIAAKNAVKKERKEALTLVGKTEKPRKAMKKRKAARKAAMKSAKKAAINCLRKHLGS